MYWKKKETADSIILKVYLLIAQTVSTSQLSTDWVTNTFPFFHTVFTENNKQFKLAHLSQLPHISLLVTSENQS